ncbi:hypothetical protein CHARACLAT_033235, partial [Characodon lateralis]|nr:hypothetical protein [Characodon lateralis]
MTPSHSSHFFKSKLNSPLCLLLSLSPVSRQIPAGRPRSSPGKGLCVSLLKTAVHTVFSWNLPTCWNPQAYLDSGLKDQINVRFKQPIKLISSQKEEKDKEL